MNITVDARLSKWALCAAFVVLACSRPSAVDFEQYRDFRLGSSVADVVQTAGVAPADVRTLHARPALLQELRWRAASTSSTQESTRTDPVSETVFSFVDDRLFRIAVRYDRQRTRGLTRTDLITALTGVYGPPAPLPPQPRRGLSDTLDAATAVAQWRAGTVTVVLQEYEYADTFALSITSTPLEQAARKAQAAAIALEAREAPRREAARAKQEADAAREEAAKVRTTNKDGFRP